MSRTLAGRTLAFVGAVTAAALVGCSRQTPAAPVSPEANLRDVMKGAPAEAQQMADAAASAVEKQEPGEAFVVVNKLATAPDLTPEQRQAAFQAAATLREQLARAAANGDPRATALLDAYRASK